MSNVNSDVGALKRTQLLIGQSVENINTVKLSIKRKLESFSSTWRDQNYQRLSDIINECTAALSDIQQALNDSKGDLSNLIASLEEYENVSLSSGGGITSGASQSSYVRRLSPDEVNASWKSTVKNVDALIDVYKEELLNRGVPDGQWLKETLAKHRGRMLEQEGYQLDAASGHADTSTNDPNAYTYPPDYPAFFDQLAREYREDCLSGTNSDFS